MTAPVQPAGGQARSGGGSPGVVARRCGHDHGPAWIVDGTVPGDPGPASGRPGVPLDPRLIGGLRWVEHGLFELVGAWVADEPCAPARVLFAVLSRQHGEHAGQLADRLPARAGVDADALTLPPPGWAPVVDLLRSGPDAVAPSVALDGTAARLVGLGRAVLPKLAGAYALALRQAGPADAPVVRVLRAVHSSTRDAWAVVDAAADRQLADAGAIEAAATWQGRLQTALSGR